MLGPDVVVEQAVGLFGRVLQDALGLGAERNLDRGRDLLTKDGAPFDFLPDVLEREVGPCKDPARQPLAFPDQPQKQVLRFDRDAPQLAGLVASEEQDPPRSFRVAFEHPAYLREMTLGRQQAKYLFAL